MESLKNTYSLHRIHSRLRLLDETLICNTAGGNKLRKLEYILAGKTPQGIITMGSVYSSHCMATAYWGMRHNIPVHLIIISDEYGKDTVRQYPYLFLSYKMGATVNFTSNESAYDFIEDYKNNYHDFFWIPGGGHTKEGLNAYKELFIKIFTDNKALRSIDWILLPYGTGTTALGIVSALHECKLDIRVIGISVSRTGERCLAAALEFVNKDCIKNLVIDDRFAGKYGQKLENQNTYFTRFIRETGIAVDPIYNIRSIQYYYDENLANGLIVNTGGGGNLYFSEKQVNK